MAPPDRAAGTAPTPETAAAAAIRVGEPAFVDGALHWVQSAPDGTGRSVLVAESPAGLREVSPPGSALRSRLFGYGAGSWCASPTGIVGVDATTQSLVRLGVDAAEPVGPDPTPGDTIGDPVAVPGSTWVVVAAEHAGKRGVRRGLAAVDVASGARVPLHVADGMCAEPQVAPDGRALAWLRWPAGTMPWDAAELWVATLEATATSIACRGPRRLDGGRGCSTGQPTWRRDGSLAYVSEAAGWWQPWVCDDGGAVRRLCDRRAEFQRPRWLTCRWLADLGADGALACAFADREGEHVAVLDGAGRLSVVEQPCVRVDGVAAAGASLAWVGASVGAHGVVCIQRRGRAPWVVASGPTAEDTPSPEPFAFVHDGAAVDGVAWRPGGREPAPLVVTVHPGPTGAVDRAYTPIVHLLTARGFALASVDHSGSTAHGRAHRERLRGRYGELDVAECTAAVAHLVGAGVADPRCCFMRGTSAGGTTALLALGSGALRGAVAWYPASRFADDADPHGFEAGYLAALTGPDGAGRSPLARAMTLHGAALLIQGAEDDVVSPDDTAALVVALRDALDEVGCVVVAGEGHGFRTAAGRATALEAELAFYLRHGVASPDGGDRYDAEATGREVPGRRP